MTGAELRELMYRNLELDPGGPSHHPKRWDRAARNLASIIEAPWREAVSLTGSLDLELREEGARMLRRLAESSFAVACDFEPGDETPEPPEVPRG